MSNNSLFKTGIIFVSFLAMLFLVWLIYFGPEAGDNVQFDYSILSLLNAILNGCATVALIFGFYFIKNRKIESHKSSMIVAFIFSSLFLISYIIYHYLHGDSRFEGEGFIRYVYFFILITHIVLSIVGLPVILLTFYFSLSGQIPAHKKIVRYTFPIWLYVSVTGVLVYIFLKFLS